ncbi:MAG: hypothetical protein HMLKMBBP_00912 [Planctomycetes bacterium]|nr:hypothetical protein [Planctomycetota bacterium]
MDDEAVLAAVYARAIQATPLPADWGVLPPRVSTLRVAVRALHDHLLELRSAPADMARLLDALAELASRWQGAREAHTLSAWIAAWRKWTPAEREIEKELAVRVTRSLDLIRGIGELRKEAIAAAFAGAPKTPPRMSPGAANLAGLRAAHAALTVPGDDWPETVTKPIDDARAAFASLGWTAGAGIWFEIAAARLERGARKPVFRATAMIEAARTAFEEGGDRFRAAMLTADGVDRARRSGDVARAVKLSELALAQLEAAKCRGREVSDVLFSRGEMLQSLGRQDEALAAFDRCAAEVRFAATDPAQVAPVEERRATSLYLLGRHAEAVAAADAGAAAYDAEITEGSPSQERLRASLDALAGEALAAAGRGKEGALRHVASAMRLARIDGAGLEALHARFLAARAQLKGGDGAGAAAAVKDEFSRTAPPPALRALGAAVLRDAGELVAARQHFERARADADPDMREAMHEEEARLLAAEGDLAGARAAFDRAERRFAPEPSKPGGPQAHRVALERAKMEERHREFAEAAAAADRAIFHLTAFPSPPPMELDQAREVLVRALRGRLRFGEAAAVAKLRVDAGPPGSAERKLDAEMDWFATRLGAARGPDDAVRVPAAREAAERISDPFVRGVALAILDRRDPPTVAGRELPGRQSAWQAAAQGALGCIHEHDVEIARWIATPESGMPSDALADLRNGAGWPERGAAEPRTDAPVVVLDDTRRGLDDIESAAQAAFVDQDTAAAGRAMQTFLANQVTVERTRPSPVPPYGDATAVVLVGAADRTPLPIDLASTQQTLLVPDATQFVWARTHEELRVCSTRDAPPTLRLLPHHDAPLAERHAIVKAGLCDPSWDDVVVRWTNEGRAKGLSAVDALREAKRRIRDEWKPRDGEKGLPPWAVYQLRGAP